MITNPIVTHRPTRRRRHQCQNRSTRLAYAALVDYLIWRGNGVKCSIYKTKQSTPIFMHVFRVLNYSNPYFLRLIKFFFRNKHLAPISPANFDSRSDKVHITFISNLLSRFTRKVVAWLVQLLQAYQVATPQLPRNLECKRHPNNFPIITNERAPLWWSTPPHGSVAGPQYIHISNAAMWNKPPTVQTTTRISRLDWWWRIKTLCLGGTRYSHMTDREQRTSIHMLSIVVGSTAHEWYIFAPFVDLFREAERVIIPTNATGSH